MPQRMRPEADAKRRRVLVVDDEEGILRTFQRIFEPLYEVTTTPSPAVALEALVDGEPFDAVVCDVRMPDMTGPMLHEAITARRPEVAARFLFVTATMPDGESIRGVPVLAKPARRRELLDAVAQIILATSATPALPTR